MATGTYEVRLRSNGGYAPIGISNQVAVSSAENTPTVTAGLGGFVDVSWSGIPVPSPRDWIGIYRPDAADNAPADGIRGWAYVNCTRAPSSGAATGLCDLTIPEDFPEGEYEIRLQVNGIPVTIAKSN